MWTIAGRELRSLFLSPLAWSILGVLQFIFGWVFAVLIYLFVQPEVQANLASDPNAPGMTAIIVGTLFDWVGIVLLLVTPLLTMRLISDERRNNTLPLLISAPIRFSHIILGKYLGVMGFLAIMLALLSLMPMALLLGGVLDFGHLTACLIGAFLLLGAFVAIGLYISTLTAQPTIAAIITFGILLLLWMIDWAGTGQEQSGLLTYLSITSHYQNLVKGLVDTQDIVYYLLLITLFLTLSIHRLDTERM
jgi:ABC-2 type transport system permease protein